MRLRATKGENSATAEMTMEMETVKCRRGGDGEGADPATGGITAMLEPTATATTAGGLDAAAGMDEVSRDTGTTLVEPTFWSPFSVKKPAATPPRQPTDSSIFGAPHLLRAFVVGMVRWATPELFPGFPGRARADLQLVHLLKKRGVPEDQLRFLKDESATVETILREFQALLADSKPGETLLFYYAGHGVQTEAGAHYFAGYDTCGDLEKSAWALSSIFQTINEGFKGARAVLMADCCHSGCLGEYIAARGARVAYASLTSAGPRDPSPGTWTFTESVLLALKGNPVVPTNGDGLITFDELAHFVTMDMALFEAQRAHVVFADGFDRAAVIAKGKRRHKQRLGERVEVRWLDDWYKARIISQKEDLLRIHYVGFPQKDEEWVSLDRVRALRATLYPEKTRVEAEWNGAWWKAEILDERGGLHYVRFLERSKSCDEWIAPIRLRLPTHDGAPD